MSGSVKDPKRRRNAKSDPLVSDMNQSRDKHSGKDREKTIDLQQKAKMVYQAEDELVARRDAKSDVALFKSACLRINDLMEQVQQLKAAKRPEVEILNKRIECSLHFLTLRKLNRLAHLRCKKVRENTIESKQKTDQYHLQLQNLLYEVSHQEKEITKCLEFKSKDEEIKLIDVNDFYRDAPIEISKPEITKADPHQLTLGRLHWELEQRKRLAEKLRETEALKEVVSKDIETKQKHLEQLHPKLSTILSATKPVQEYLNMPFDEIKEQHRIARYLPAPLYVLYMQATGYKDACDKKMSIVIDGDTEEAARLHEFVTVQQDDLSEEEYNEEDEGGEDDKKRKKHRRHVTQAEQIAAKKRELLKAHPLNIVIVLQCKDGLSLKLVFSHLTTLGIVTIRPELIGYDCDGDDGDLLIPGLLLQCLYPGDDGQNTPNPANHYQLTKRGLNFTRDCLDHIGTPYHWVQWLAGLQFLSKSDSVLRADTELSGSIMDEVMKKLRKRVGYRLALQAQTSAIAKGVVSVQPSYQAMFPVKINSKMLSWQRRTFDDYKVMKHCDMFVEEGLVQETDMFYQAVIESGSARLTAQVSISPDYPSQRPLFALCLTWTGEKTRYNDENVRALEAEVNLYNDDLNKTCPNPHLLTNQLQRLMACLDVYLETTCCSDIMTSPIEFPREKIMPRMTRGPQRGMPFRYLDHLSLFTQR